MNNFRLPDHHYSWSSVKVAVIGGEQAAWNEQLGLTFLTLLTELKARLLWHLSKPCQDFVYPKIPCLVYFFTSSVLSLTFRHMINTNVKNPCSHVLWNPSPLISTGSTHSD